METFDLTWRDYQNVATGMFGDLFNDKDFTDVTLVCADSKQTKSHKVILSSCSTLFKEILSSNVHQHPLIFLKGINIDTLSKIMEFVYKGKTEVEQENLEAFLDAAKDLKIKGLVGEVIEAINDIEEEDVETETKIENAKVEVNEDVECIDLAEDMLGTDNIVVDLEQFDGRDLEKTFTCNRCGGNYTSGTVLKRHLLAVHERIKQQCFQCAKDFSTLDSLKRHKKASHDGVKYSCKKCGKCFTSTTAMKRHKDMKHTK